MAPRIRLLESTATSTAPPVDASKMPPAPPPPKRPRKTEVRYRGRIYLVSGEKGGVGKTLGARSLVELLRMFGFNVHPVEADAANRDIERIFSLGLHINLQQDSGYMDLLNYIEKIKGDNDIVISLPAGALAGAEARGPFFIESLKTLSEELNREVIVIWPIDDKITSVEMLDDFVELCPNIRVDVMHNEFFFKEFAIYDKSNLKKKIEKHGGKSLKFPRLSPVVMQKLVNDNLSFGAALKSLPIGFKGELQYWIRKIEKAFKEAGYLDHTEAE